MYEVIKGDICYSEDTTHLYMLKDAYLVWRDGVIDGVFKELPDGITNYQLKDYSGHLIVPGLIDLHIHAPQYSYRGLGMDMELLEWLNTYAFPEESKYVDDTYAHMAYSQFVHDMKYSPTTRFCAFATTHTDATLRLMEMLEAEGMIAYVGKVNMDRNSPDYYCESSAKESTAETIRWIEAASRRFTHVKPIVTPRFTPSCSDELMQSLGQLTDHFHLPMQSHLSENLAEIDWVQQLCPWSKKYIDTYKVPGLIGADHASIMAHCVHSDEKELAVMKENRVFAVHCPQCNMNIASGIAPVRKWLDAGVSVGLGSDIGGGASVSIFRAMMEAMQVSKLVWRLKDQRLNPLSLEEMFYLGTKGGGAFFGNVGSFEKGYAADVLVLDESRMPYHLELTIRQRIERYICLSGPQDLCHKFIAGRQIF